MSPGPTLLVAALGLAVAILAGYNAPRLWLAGTLAGATAMLAIAISSLAGGRNL